MDTLYKFVEAWEKNGKVEAIFDANIPLPPAEEVQSYLSTLPEEERARIQYLLAQALSAFSDYADKLETEAGTLKTQIDQNVQASNACLTYNKVPKKSRPD